MNSTLNHLPAASTPSRRCKDCDLNDHAPGRPVCWRCLDNRLSHPSGEARWAAEHQVRVKQRRIAAGGDLEV